MSVSAFLEAFSSWVTGRPDIAAAALVGSHARGTATPTSDIDLVVLAFDPDELLDGDWPQLFGDVESRTFEDYGALRSLRVFYRGGIEVEFGIARPSWVSVPLDSGTKEVLADGVRILHDPGRLLEVATRAVLA